MGGWSSQRWQSDCRKKCQTFRQISYEKTFVIQAAEGIAKTACFLHPGAYLADGYHSRVSKLTFNVSYRSQSNLIRFESPESD
jgi:hypothetical protein